MGKMERLRRKIGLLELDLIEARADYKRARVSEELLEQLMDSREPIQLMWRGKRYTLEAKEVEK